jgi:hypothetical protein
VEKITVTQNGEACPYMSYLYTKVTDRFSFLPADSRLVYSGDRTVASFQSEEKYCPYIRNYTEERIADVIAVGYKYNYFASTLRLPCLSKKGRELLFVALVSADLAEDRGFIRRKVSGSEEYCIDGTYHFRLSELKTRWKGIADYVPTDFSESSLDGFLDFLIGESNGKVFLKDGKLYDEDYRRLDLSSLIGKENPIYEILLSGPDNIYCFGKTDAETREFLKKYYKEKAVFC